LVVELPPLPKYARHDLSNLQSANPPAALGSSGEELAAMLGGTAVPGPAGRPVPIRGELSSLQALQDKISATISGIEGLLGGAVNSLLSGCRAMSDQLESAVGSALP